MLRLLLAWCQAPSLLVCNMNFGSQSCPDCASIKEHEAVLLATVDNVRHTTDGEHPAL